VSADPVDAPTAEDEPPTPPRYYPEVAHAIREAGYSPLPLPEGQKHNPPDGWTGGDGAWASAADVQAWADDPAHQKANTAARLPRQVVGLDVDCYDGKPGAETWYELAKEHGKPPPTWVVTARGSSFSGVRLFRLSPGFDQFLLGGGLPGIEIIRFGHRYVTAPGSVHPDLGTTYVATNLDTGEVLVDSMPPAADLPVLSLSWCEAFSKAARSQSKAKARAKAQGNGSSHAAANGSGATPAGAAAGRHRAQTDGEMCKATLAAFAAAVADLHSGVSRHDSAVESSLSLLRHGDMGHQGVHKAISQLGAAYVAAKSTERVDAAGTVYPALTASEAVADFEAMCNGALAILDADPTPDGRRMCCGTGAAADAPENSSGLVIDPDEVAEQWRYLMARREAQRQIDEADYAAARGARVRRTMAEFVKLPPIPAVISDILAAEVNLLGGPSEAGKSLLARDWSLAVAAGVPWRGYAVPERRAVLWVASEGLQDAAIRWTTQPLWADAKDRVEVLEGVNLLSQSEVDGLLADYANVKPGLVVFDVIYGMGMSDDNGFKDVGPVIQAMKNISAAWGAATLALGHPPLSGGRRFRGSGTWNQLAATEWHAAEGMVTCEKSKIADKSKLRWPYAAEYPDIVWQTPGQVLINAFDRQALIVADIAKHPNDPDTVRADRLGPQMGLKSNSARDLIRTVKRGGTL
jgi:hypothetical protein